MAKANHYVVYIERRSDASLKDLEEVMNLANDWYRIRYNCWILYSTSDSEKWYSRLSPLVEDSGNVFICKLDLENSQGWMTKEFWAWLRREDGPK